MDFSKLIKEIKTDPANTPWYKKKVSIIAMSSTLGVGVLTTAIAVPVALTSGSSTSAPTLENVSIKNIYDLNNHYVKLIISGKGLPTDLAAYKVFNSALKNTRAQISNIQLIKVGNDDIQLQFNDSTVTATSKYQVVINDGTPIDVKESFLQPIININTQPSNKTISTTSHQIVTLTIAASIQNPIQNQSTPNYQWYSSDTNNQSDPNSWEEIYGAKNNNFPFDATNLTVSTKKYFRCIVSYQYTEIKPSSSVFIEKQTTPTGPTQQEITAAINTFNAKSNTEKINAYNTIMANAANNTSIKDYILKQGGMSRFFNANVLLVTSGNKLDIYNAFKALLQNHNDSNLNFTPADGSDFLKIKGTGTTNPSTNETTNVSDNNIYCMDATLVSNKVGSYKFLSPILNSITNVTMNSDFSITMTLPTVSNIINVAFDLVDKTNYSTSQILYNTTITFSNTTLFPGMSEFVKRSLLNLAI